MHDWYTTEYAILSKATHTHVRELESYLSFSETGEIKSLKYAPAIEQVRHLLLEAAHCILLGADAVSHTFDIAFGSKASEHLTFIERELASPGESNTQLHGA
jgi:hypothetical protein